MNKVFAVKGFPGHYPVGTAAVVCAPDKPEAYELLINQLIEGEKLGEAEVRRWVRKFLGSPHDPMKEVGVSDEPRQVIMLCNGDY